MTLLALEGLSKSYGPVEALVGIDLLLAAASLTAVVGPSGSGKTTLLRLTAGFEAPDRGRVVLDGAVLADGAGSLPAHRRSIGYVAQDGALFPHLSVAENIGFGLDRHERRRTERVADLMRVVDLEPGMARRAPHELSGGQQQRVALARALARRPRLMLLDEPFSALDAGLREATREAVARILATHGIACILVTHDQGEALSFADQVAVLRDGRLAQVGAPRDLYLRPVDARTATFLGDAVLLQARLRDGIAESRLGRVAVEGSHRDGPVEIMLRPEQIRLVPAIDRGPGGTEPPFVTGRVATIAFAGALSTVTVTLETTSPAARGAGRPLRDPPGIALRALSTELPAIGDRVAIWVVGRAHVLGGAPAGPDDAPGEETPPAGGRG